MTLASLHIGWPNAHCLNDHFPRGREELLLSRNGGQTQSKEKQMTKIISSRSAAAKFGMFAICAFSVLLDLRIQGRQRVSARRHWPMALGTKDRSAIQTSAHSRKRGQFPTYRGFALVGWIQGKAQLWRKIEIGLPDPVAQAWYQRVELRNRGELTIAAARLRTWSARHRLRPAPAGGGTFPTVGIELGRAPL
jgi:hypothetical protein